VSAPDVRRAGAHAMATEFQILFTGIGSTRAEMVGAEVLRMLETLEAELSRFRDSSDVSRLNHAAAGETVTLNEAAADCIALALDVHGATGGAFDITIGPLLSVWSTPEFERREPSETELKRAKAASGLDKIELCRESRRATVHGAERWLDLGGIGKGYALDRMAAALREEHDIDNALLDAGGSTLLAMGDGPEGKGWPAGTGVEDGPAFDLRDRALSGSGFSERGEHIIDPRTARPVPSAKFNAWALAPTAALADALSTAFLVMDEPEIEAFCSAHPDVGAVLPESGAE